MRVMLRVAMDTDKTNELILDGTMSSTIDEILAKLKPESAYFHAMGGGRGFTLVIDAPDAASLPSLVEPLWLQVGATIDVVPVMNADELSLGLSRLR